MKVGGAKVLVLGGRHAWGDNRGLSFLLTHTQMGPGRFLGRGSEGSPTVGTAESGPQVGPHEEGGQVGGQVEAPLWVAVLRQGKVPHEVVVPGEAHTHTHWVSHQSGSEGVSEGDGFLRGMCSCSEGGVCLF